MNFVNYNREPLPLALPVAQAQRAGSGAGLKLADSAMLDFNSQLHGVRAGAPSVDAGQIETLANWLKSLPAEMAEATIALRLSRAETLRRMLEDPDWQLPDDVAERGRRLYAYILRVDDLIPDGVPLLGHLDDALLVELSWSEFAGEVQDYLDFCRFCGDGSTRGTAVERRSAWESECLAQASDMLHRQQVRERGYSRPAPLTRPFRVC